MFDANLRYLPKGYKFFADISGVNDKLTKLGLRSGDVVQCHMLNESHHDPLVDILLNGKITTISGRRSERLYMVFAGHVSGSGFIEEDSYIKAKYVAALNGNPFTHIQTKKFYIPSRNKRKALDFCKNYGAAKKDCKAT